MSNVKQHHIEFYETLLRIRRTQGVIEDAKAKAAAVRVLRKYYIEPTPAAIREVHEGAARLAAPFVAYISQYAQ